METILPGLLVQLVEQDVHTADGALEFGWVGFPAVRTDSLRTAGPLSYRLRSRIANPRGLPFGLIPGRR
jgi:hypothetical protein